MGIARVYIKPFQSDGSLATDFIEVTKYVNSIGQIEQDADSLDYQVGVFRNSQVSLSLNNRKGYFSDIDVQQSIFRFKRNGSLVKITYQEDPESPRFGFARAGFCSISNEVDVFLGLLNDESLSMDALSENVQFVCLGRESLFDLTQVPFSSISVGDTFQTILYTLLNQSPITDYLTVSLANINPAIDEMVDDITDLENKTVKDVIDGILLLANSVLYISGDSVYVSGRVATVDVKETFYGQGSIQGAENIINITEIKNGSSRQFNEFTWANSTYIQKNNDSTDKYGVKKTEISSTLLTNITKINTVLAALVAEFKDAKQEFKILTPLSYSTLALNILDRILVDYPTVYVPGDFPLPICGLAICGEAVLPLGLWSFKVNPSISAFKILSKSHDFKSLVSTFKLRMI